jgi:hypothetical protein
MIKLDFSKIAYNIENIPEEESVVHRFSDLASQAHIFDRSDDLPSGVDADKVLRYLIYMFAPGTPVREAYPDINQRKRYTLNKLNIVVDENDTTDEGYVQLCLMNAEWAVDRYIAFTRLQCSEDYSIMSTADIRIAALQRALLTQPVDRSNDDKNFQEGLERWRQTLVSARTRIMNEESSVMLQKSITFSVRAENLGIQPEHYSRVWREKKEIFPEIIP